MKAGDKVFCIMTMKYGVIAKVEFPEKYFVIFDDGVGFWFRRNELTEGL